MSSSTPAVRALTSHRFEGTPVRPAELWQQVMDSLESQLAVLDHTGTVIAGNQAWHRSAADAGVLDGFVGTSYVDVCRTAGPDPWAEQAYEGLRDVLAGSRTRFTLTYPCLDRWYSMVAVAMPDRRPDGRPDRNSDRSPEWLPERLPGQQGLRVVVTHVDITTEHTAQRDVSSTRNYLAAVTDSMGEGLIVLDGRGVLTLVNAAAESMLGWSAEELVGQGVHLVIPRRGAAGTPYDEERGPSLVTGHGSTATHTHETTLVRRDGTKLPVSYTAAPLRSPEGHDGRVVVFTDATALHAERDRLRREARSLHRVRRVRAAIDEHRLVLYGQPIVDLHTGEAGPTELLLRVVEEDGTVAAPGPYLATAEKHGLIGEIDRWVIQESIRHAAAGHSVELNVSGLSLGDPTLVPQIASWLQETAADPSRLVFEITETALIADQDSAFRFVQQIRTLGCRVALDDFGTGFGGFTYLKNLPVDYLKIDIEFVRDLTRESASRHVVEAVVNLARGFGLTTIAEGVENAETQELLRQLGVGFGQGFHVGRPAPLVAPSPAW